MGPLFLLFHIIKLYFNMYSKRESAISLIFLRLEVAKRKKEGYNDSNKNTGYVCAKRVIAKIRLNVFRNFQKRR